MRGYYAYSENVLRENLTPIELGRMYESLLTMLKENNSAKLQNVIGLEGLKFSEKLEKLTHFILTCAGIISFLRDTTRL